MQEIITPRLSLRLMTEDFLEANLNDNLEKAESLIGLKLSQNWFDEKDIISVRLNDYRTDAEFANWGLWAIGLLETEEMIGFIGFHTKPNPEYLREFAPNAIEFGYTIFFQNRRQGFAQEALIGLMNWSIKQYPLENFIASVAPNNIASTAMVKKLLFKKIGEQIDEIDGLEFVYSLAAEKLKMVNSL